MPKPTYLVLTTFLWLLVPLSRSFPGVTMVKPNSTPVVRATGHGAPIPGWKGPAARNSALAAAMVEACADLLLSLHGPNTEASVTVKKSEVQTERTKSSISGVINGRLLVSLVWFVEDLAFIERYATVRVLPGNSGAAQREVVIRTRGHALMNPSPNAAVLLRSILSGEGGGARIVDEKYNPEDQIAAVVMELPLSSGETPKQPFDLERLSK